MKVKTFICSGLAALALAAPAAQAGTSPSDYLGHEYGGPGGAGIVLPSDYLGHPLGGPGGAGVVLPSDYLGHPLGGPGGGGPIVATTAVPAVDGFDWPDALIGGGFVGGLALFAAGAAMIARRRRVSPLAH